MAALSNEDRTALWASIMQELSRDRQPCSITKAELRAAVDAIDGWIDANTVAFNTAIPQPARGALTTKQKARLLSLIVQRRFEVT